MKIIIEKPEVGSQPCSGLITLTSLDSGYVGISVGLTYGFGDGGGALLVDIVILP